MLVQRGLDRTPLCPLCPHTAPLSRPRGDRTLDRLLPVTLGSGGRARRDRIGTSRAAAAGTPRLSPSPCGAWAGNGRQEVGRQEVPSCPLPDGPALVLSSALCHIPGDPSLQHSGRCRRQVLHRLWRIPWHPGLWAQGKNARGGGCPGVTPNQSDP